MNKLIHIYIIYLYWHPDKHIRRQKDEHNGKHFSTKKIKDVYATELVSNELNEGQTGSQRSFASKNV